MLKQYSDLHWGKYDSPLAYYLDANFDCYDYDEDASLEHSGEWAGRIGKRINYVDSQGFHYVWRYADETEAAAEFELLTADWYEDDDCGNPVIP